MSTPRFSVVIAVQDPSVDELRATVGSVTGQTLPDWELCIVDDASQAPAVGAALRELAADEPRIRLGFRCDRAGVAQAANDAIATASGEFVAFVDQGDRLAREALSVMNHALNFDAADYAYSDETELLPDGSLGRSFLKPDWSPERLRAQMYAGHLAVVRRSVIDAVGGLRRGLDGAHDHDLALRVTELGGPVIHVPAPLYLLRVTANGDGAGEAAPARASDAGRRAVQAHCDRLGIPAQVEPLALNGLYRVRRRLIMQPLVSVVVAVGGASGRRHRRPPIHALESVRAVLDTSTYRRFEVVVVADHDTLDALRSSGEQVGGAHHVVVADPVNPVATARNVGAAASNGELLVFLDPELELVTPDWLETLAGLAVEPDCGMVGAGLQSSDGALDHGGYVLAGGAVRNAVDRRNPEHDGSGSELAVERECSAVSAASAMVRREVWDQVGGMCEGLSGEFQEVDFALKIRRSGRRIVWTPHAVLRRHEAPSGEWWAPAPVPAMLGRRWNRSLDRDPYLR